MTEETIFATALEKSPDARTAYLAEACGNDEALRKRLEGLLAASDKVGNFMAKPAVASAVDPIATQELSAPGESAAKAPIENRPPQMSDSDEEPLTFLAPGTRPDSLGRLGHYEVLQVLGKGGFGIVFRAFDEMLQRVVALKVMSPQLAATSPARRRFLREARSSAQVRHENVVQVYEVAEQPLPYLGMEFIPGETLQQKLDRVGPLDALETLRIGRQIAEGLAAAHAMDLIHRDIKPGNVLLEGGQHKVKITDFGLARAADDASISQSGIIAGTPMYMAPEQAKGDKLDQRADLFSLGSVLYQMVSGRPPFRANSTVAVLKRVADDTPRPIREIIPETPQWLCDIIAKLHAKNPDDRYQSAREVADVLADCEAQLKANAKLKDYSRIPRSTLQRSGRRKWVAVAAAVLLPVIALIVTEFAGVTHLFRKQQTADDAVRVESGPKFGPAGSLRAGTVPPGAVLVMNFAKDTFFEKDGKTWVRDLSGRGNDGVCEDVSFTPDGKVGGGLACQGGALRIPHSLIHGQANYTITGWCRSDAIDRGGHCLYLSGNSSRPAPLFMVTVQAKRSIFVNAWNKDHDPPNYWLGVATKVEVVPDQGWYFFAVTMRDGGVGRGTLRVTVNETIYPLNTQMVKAHDGINVCDLVGHGASGTVIDELAVFQRALSDDEVRALRELGRNNVPLESGDPEYTNTLGMKFKLIPAGKFTMGSPKEEIDRCLKQPGPYKGNLPTEGPEHPVEITRPFYLGATEVTVGQFRQFVDEEAYQVGDGRWRNPGFDQTDQHPVVFVSWNNAVDFCKWLSAKEGKEYRLPTEAEWEYSCRAGKAGSRYGFGDNDAQLKDYAWFDQNSGGGTHPVGKKKPNAWGLYDMHGNAWEWCQDNYDPDYYKNSPVKDPPGGAGGARAGRGGGWLHGPVLCRSAFRGYLGPDDHIGAGFRVLLVSPPAGVGTESGAKDKPASTATAPFTDADVQRIAALPAPQQVEEVRKELKRRNPGFGGQADPTFERGVVTELEFTTDHMTDISPIRALTQLRNLKIKETLYKGRLADLTPLKGMKLTNLQLWYSHKLVDLTPLKGMTLENLDVWHWSGSDLTPLKGMPLKRLNCGGSGQKLDLAPLKGAPLEDLCLNVTQVSDLTPLKDMPLTTFLCGRTRVSDLTPLRGMRLRVLYIYKTGITDVTPLQGMPLEEIRLTPKNITQGLDILRDMKSLQTIGIEADQAWPAAEFWERYDKGEFGKAAAPFTDADVQRIAALPAEQQVEEVQKELKRRNPGFDGRMETKIEGDIVTEFRIVTDKVTDFVPIRVWGGLRTLVCSGTYTNQPNGLLADLTPLQGMNLAGLTHLNLNHTRVGDAGLAIFKDCKDLLELHLWNTKSADAGLANFKDCKNLTLLDLGSTRVSDAGLANFKDCKDLTHVYLHWTKVSDAGLVNLQDCKDLMYLSLGGTKVSDTGLAHFKNCKNLISLHFDRTRIGDAGLAPFKGLPLTSVWLDNTGITDLTPLQGMPLEEIHLTPKNITRGLDILRDMKSLKTIGIAWQQDWPAAEFWERYDKGEFGKAAAPFTDADVQRIAALPAEQQVEEVRKELKRRNPGFDGKMETKIEGDVVTELRIVTDKVMDLAPIRVWSALRLLECGGTWTNGPNGLLADLAPLHGMAALTHLNLMQTKVTDAGIAYLKSCKGLRYVNLNNTRVTDKGLAHLKDCQALAILDVSATKVTDEGLAHFKDCRALTHLLLGGTKVRDAGLAHFKGVPLILLWIDNTGITDLTPVQGMPLEEIRLPPKNIIRGLDILRDMQSLKTIGIDFNHAWPAAEFWKRYDKGEFK